MEKHISTFLTYRKLLFQLTKNEVKLKYRRSYLGIIWSLLNPLLTMVVMTIVFATLFKRDIQNYPVYLLSGKVIFDFFSQSTNKAMGSIVGNQAMLKKIYVPKYVFPVSGVLANFVNLFFSLIAMIIVMLVTRTQFHWTLIFVPLPLLYICLFSIGMGLILATINVFFRDMSHLYSILLVAWSYLTPLFYPADILPENYYFIQRYNPLHHIIKMMRSLVIDGVPPTLKSNLICIISVTITLIIGLYLFYKKQDKFILYI